MGGAALGAVRPLGRRSLADALVSITGDRLAPQPATADETATVAAPGEDRQFLRNVARRTWRYFSDFVNEKTSWLPPDNYQVSYQNQLAMRTSPTNIGLWMVSVLGAHDFGYITVDEVTRKLTGTMETIGKLDRHEGHLLNWYDIQTLAPLKPRYVSTVDSGNLLGAFWSLDQGLGALMQTELLDKRAFAGLRDAGEALRQAVVAEKYLRPGYSCPS